MLFAAAVVVRIVLVFSGYSYDLSVYMKMGDLWVAGEPPYQSGPYYGYLPFYLYIIGLARVIAGTNVLLYSVLIKAPLVVMDLYLGWLVVKYVFDNTGDGNASIKAGAMYFFNPLVLYIVAYCGRMDLMMILFVFLAVMYYSNSIKSNAFLAAAVCAKTVPLFLYSYFLMKDRKRIISSGLILISMVVMISLPLVIKYDVGKIIIRHSLIGYANATPRGLSWMVGFYSFLDIDTILKISKVVMLGFVVFLLAYPKRSLFGFSMHVHTAFMFFSKFLYGRYAVWALPFYIADYCINKRPATLFMYKLFTVSGFIFCEHFRLFEIVRFPQTPYNIFFAGCIVWYLIDEYKRLNTIKNS